MRRVLLALLAVLVAATTTAIATAPPPLLAATSVVKLPDDLERHLARSEAQADREFGLIPGTEKRIRWYRGDRGKRTPYSLVYLHGFSATRQEIAPVGDMIADALAANLFETRLTGHGRTSDALQDVRAEDWLRDATEALAIGARIGERVIVVGTSTGATLAMALSDHALANDVDTFVLLSPNFAPADGGARFLTWPGGPQLAHLLIGSEYAWTARNSAQELYWTTRYPVDSLVEMMRLVEYTRTRFPLTMQQRVLTIMSPADTVVRPEETRRTMAEITAANKLLIEYAASSDTGQHVLAGDILSPDSNEIIAAYIVDFVASGNRPAPAM